MDTKSGKYWCSLSVGGFSSISGFDLVNPEDFDEQIQDKYHAGDISIENFEKPHV